MNAFQAWQSKQSCIILDGAMSTRLEELGLDLNDPLWTAKALLQDPEKIYQVHLDYFNAGANIAITNSYQASMASFKKMGLSIEEGRALVQQSVELAK